MSSILEEGFLATDIESWISENIKKKGTELNLARETNRLAQSIFLSSVPHGDRGLLLAATFARMLEHFQAIVILEERNINNSATALVRVLLEVAFSLVACVKHEDFHYKLADWDALAVKRLGESLQKVSSEASLLTIAELEIINKQVKQAKEDIKTLKTKNKEEELSSDDELKVYRIAEYAGMKDFYHAIYCVFSSTVHSAVRNLGGHVEINETHDIKRIVWGPDQPQGYALATGIAVMLHTMEAYLALHPSSNFTSNLQLLLDRLRIIEEATMANLDNQDTIQE